MIEPTGKFWETLYSKNIGNLIGICYRYTSDRQLSQDLAHDAFLKAMKKSGSFKGKGPFEAWLRKIVVNHALQYIRDQKKTRELNDWLQQESSVVQTEENEFTINSSAYPEFSEQELLDAIQALPEHHRLVFNLYVIDNFTHAQIGEMVGISEGTSKSHLARARTKIRQLLQGKTGEKQDRKRSRILFFLPWSIDRLYQRHFHEFAFLPKKNVSPDFGVAPEVPIVNLKAVTSAHYLMAAASCVTIFSVTFYLYTKNTTVPAQSNGNLKQQEIVNARENNSSASDSMTATVFQNSVIPVKNKNNKRMKNLDSLGTLLLLSSSIIFDTTAQSNLDQDTATRTETKAPIAVDGSGQISDVKKEDGNNGTFSASSIFWSDDNNELYLKGSIRVDVGTNHFNSTGSVSFLGPVYFLVVNDKPVALNSTIKLSPQQYKLTTLSASEAVGKYGEKGRNGAVEISVIE